MATVVGTGINTPSAQLVNTLDAIGQKLIYDKLGDLVFKPSPTFWYLNRNAKKFRSTITVNRKRILLGQFDTAQEALEAYCKAAKEMHGEFARTDGPRLPKGDL